MKCFEKKLNLVINNLNSLLILYVHNFMNEHNVCTYIKYTLRLHIQCIYAY